MRAPGCVRYAIPNSDSSEGLVEGGRSKDGKRGGLLFHPTSENYNGAAQPQHYVISLRGFSRKHRTRRSER